MDPTNQPAAPTTDPSPPAPVDPAAAPEATEPQGTGTTKPEPTAPAPQTPDPDLPDHGIDPDKGIDPDAGDDPTGTPPEDPLNNPDKPADPDNNKVEGENQSVDLKTMSRSERAQYFQSLEANTRKDAEARVNEVYQPQPVDDLKQKYIDEGHSEFEASMLAREEARDQEADISRARAERAELNASLAIESTEVMATIEWLNPQKKDAYDKVSSDAAIELYDELCITRDENTNVVGADGKPIPGTGQIIGASMTPKRFYGLIHTIRSSGTETVKLSAQKAAEEQLAAVAAPSSNSNKRNPDFDSLSNAEKREKLRASGHLVT